MLLDSWQKSSPGAPDSDRAAALLPDLKVLRFTGSDVFSFLQGYFTIDTNALQGGAVRLTALTNLQGRVVANGWCASPRPDVLEWVVHESLSGHVAEFLRRYLAFSRTTLEVRADDHLVLGLLAADAAPTVRVVDSDHELAELRADHVPVPVDRWRVACVDARIAVVSDTTTGLFLPQMLGLVAAGAVDFDKGCYLGQEVVARAQHRGEVKRGLVRLSGPLPLLAAGHSLTDADGRQVGTVLGGAAADAAQHCLAVVRLPALAAYGADTASFTVF